MNGVLDHHLADLSDLITSNSGPPIPPALAPAPAPAPPRRSRRVATTKRTPLPRRKTTPAALPSYLQFFRTPADTFLNAHHHLAEFQQKINAYQPDGRYVMPCSEFATNVFSSDITDLLQQFIQVYIAKFSSETVHAQYLHENVWYLIARLFHEFPGRTELKKKEAFILFHQRCQRTDMETNINNIKAGKINKALPHLFISIADYTAFFKKAKRKDFLVVFNQGEPTEITSICGVIDVVDSKFPGAYPGRDPIVVGLICSERGVSEVGDLMFFYYMYTLVNRATPSVGLLELAGSYMNLPGLCLYYKYGFRSTYFVGEVLNPATFADFYSDDHGFGSSNLIMDFKPTPATSAQDSEQLMNIFLRRVKPQKPVPCEFNADKNATYIKKLGVFFWQRFRFLDDIMTKVESGIQTSPYIEYDNNDFNYLFLQHIAKMLFPQNTLFSNVNKNSEYPLNDIYSQVTDKSEWNMIHAKIKLAADELETDPRDLYKLFSVYPSLAHLNVPAYTPVFPGLFDDFMEASVKGKNIFLPFLRAMQPDYRSTSKIHEIHQNYIKDLIKQAKSKPAASAASPSSLFPRSSRSTLKANRSFVPISSLISTTYKRSRTPPPPTSSASRNVRPRKSDESQSTTTNLRQSTRRKKKSVTP